MEALTHPETLFTLSQALRILSPSTVLDSKDLQRDFHQFFLRGDQNQCLKLVPPPFRPTSQQPQEEQQSQERSHKRRRCLNNSPAEGSLLVKPIPPLHPPLPAAQLPKESLPFSLTRADKPENGHRYTKRQISDANGDTDKQRKSPTNKIERLKAAFIDGPFPISSSQQIWSSTESLIDWNLPTPGRRLYSIMKDIEARLTIDFIASRFSLVYATFEVDHKSSEVGSDYGKRKSRAFKMVAKDWGCDVKQVKQVEKRGKNYINLMGDNLAIILELKPEVSVMCEYQLTNRLRQAIARWHEQRYPSEKRIERFILAAKIILKGLYTYGKRQYSYSSLRDSPSRLLIEVKRYITWDNAGIITPKPLSGLLDNPGQPSSQRLENAANTPGSSTVQFHPPETVNLPCTSSSLQIPIDAGPQASPDFNGMNMDSYNNAYQDQAPICPTPVFRPAASASFIETDLATLVPPPAAESTQPATSEQPWHPAAFASFIEIDPASQPATESTSEQQWHPAASASFIETDPATLVPPPAQPATSEQPWHPLPHFT
ncbi:hypothetical protein I7I51_04474 [Histoplasma capsulatum]|uniref:Uncharacterized protein n=1 Tax=Ajellomyces capsulatus TaxID=5037 RepID=A0A8A1MDR6_AJECA|nr:predicted protein [Histoplasma mississippiense (nom. inval.)]EDN07612.1 predicted protein [Histoplasma mississippiense (nom. inval.)]QSS62297.1 hypothetical protein I7I51_04474 [Histoplasma capsulatum]